MITLTEELRNIIDSLDEYGHAPVDAKSMENSKFKKKTNIVPSTTEGRLREQLIDFIKGRIFEIQTLEIDNEKKKEIEAKLSELVNVAQEKFQ